MGIKTTFKLKGFPGELKDAYARIKCVSFVRDEKRLRRDTTFAIYHSKEAYDKNEQALTEHTYSSYLSEMDDTLLISAYTDAKKFISGDDVLEASQTTDVANISTFDLPTSVKEIEDEIKEKLDGELNIEKSIQSVVDKLVQAFPTGTGQKIAVWTSFTILMIFNMFVALAKLGIYDIFALLK